jgi:hypothetical protein
VFFRLNRSARAQGSQWKEKFWILERTDHDQASPEKAHSFLVRYSIFEFFKLNRSVKAQGFQWKEKISILELTPRETPEKVKMCLN